MSYGVAVLIGAGAVVVASAVPSFISLLNSQKLNTIHLLVNSKLDAALGKIAELEREAGGRDQRDMDRENQDREG